MELALEIVKAGLADSGVVVVGGDVPGGEVDVIVRAAASSAWQNAQ
jgi:hypothetical protein